MVNLELATWWAKKIHPHATRRFEKDPVFPIFSFQEMQVEDLSLHEHPDHRKLEHGMTAASQPGTKARPVALG